MPVTSPRSSLKRWPKADVVPEAAAASVRMAAHMCYDCRMVTVASRELRNRTRQLLERVEAGEDVTITVDGRPVARLTQVAKKPQWVHRDVLIGWLAEASADSGLRGELDALLTEWVDDREIG